MNIAKVRFLPTMGYNSVYVSHLGFVNPASIMVLPLSNDFINIREMVENHRNPLKISVPTELCD